MCFSQLEDEKEKIYTPASARAPWNSVSILPSWWGSRIRYVTLRYGARNWKKYGTHMSDVYLGGTLLMYRYDVPITYIIYITCRVELHVPAAANYIPIKLYMLTW